MTTVRTINPNTGCVHVQRQFEDSATARVYAETAVCMGYVVELEGDR